MRPAPRLMAAVLAALVLTGLILVSPGVPPLAAAVLWAGLVAAVALDLGATATARGWAPVLEGPTRVFAGEEIVLRLVGPDVPADARLRVDWPEGLDGPDDAPWNARLGVTGRSRGVWRIERAWVAWPSAWTLFEIVVRPVLDHEVAVEPNIRPVQSGEIDLTVRSSLYGVKDVSLVGDGAEFHQLRDFQAGMDPRTIDWKRSARRFELVARETRAERNHQIILAVDQGSLMRQEIEGLARLDHAINAALALAWAGGLGGDLVGLFTYDSRPRLWLPPRPGRAAFPRLRAEAANIAYGTSEANHTLGLATLGGNVKRRSMIVVFTDFVDTVTAELLVENLAVLGRHHVTVFVTMKDRETLALADAPGEGIDAAALSLAAGRALRDRTLVQDRLRRLGLMVLDVAPGDLTPSLVATYLEIKAREAI